ncbi:MAG: cyclic nucleotide-binding domain-containing protein [Pseudomonadota bacterium]
MTEQSLTIEELRRFSPLDGLKTENLTALAKKTQVKTLEPSQLMFNEGDTEKRTYYVVSGTVELLEQGTVSDTVKAGGSRSRSPLSPGLPRRYSARAHDTVRYLSIDSDLLDVMLTWDQTGSYEVSELRDDPTESNDWMTTLLQSKAFHKIPPANIQAIFMRMQQVNYKGGDQIIKQGTDGDFFYVLTRGAAAVTRETPLNKEGIRLAELTVGDTFGEEALIAESKRNATVTMLTDGAVMRLGKDDFRTLLNEPMLDWVDMAQAQKIVDDGGGVWLDVRLPSEYQNFSKPGSINMPLYFIRLKLGTLDPQVPYIVCCDTGRRSSAGAYIMNERGFKTYVLRGGLAQA